MKDQLVLFTENHLSALPPAYISPYISQYVLTCLIEE